MVNAIVELSRTAFAALTRIKKKDHGAKIRGLEVRPRRALKVNSRHIRLHSSERRSGSSKPGQGTTPSLKYTSNQKNALQLRSNASTKVTRMQIVLSWRPASIELRKFYGFILYRYFFTIHGILWFAGLVLWDAPGASVRHSLDRQFACQRLGGRWFRCLGSSWARSRPFGTLFLRNRCKCDSYGEIDSSQQMGLCAQHLP